MLSQIGDIKMIRTESEKLNVYGDESGEYYNLKREPAGVPKPHSLLEGHAKGRRPSCPYVKSAVRLGDSASQRYAP